MSCPEELAGRRRTYGKDEEGEGDLNPQARKGEDDCKVRVLCKRCQLTMSCLKEHAATRTVKKNEGGGVFCPQECKRGRGRLFLKSVSCQEAKETWRKGKDEQDGNNKGRKKSQTSISARLILQTRWLLRREGKAR